MKKRYRGVVSSNRLEKPSGVFTLFRNVYRIDGDKDELFREHVWIRSKDSKQQLKRIRLHQVIEFDAIEYEYFDSNLETKKSLRKIRNIEVVGKQKLGAKNASEN